MKCGFKIVLNLFLCLILASFAYANDKREMPESSPTHVIGFTFHKLAGTEPNYNQWVDVYLKGKLLGYSDLARQERIRAARSRFVANFNNFFLEHHPEIVATLPAKLEVIPFEGKYMMNISLGADLNFLIRETPEYAINFVVPNLEEKFKTIISVKEYNKLKDASGYKFEKPQNVSIALRLKPVSVDASEPLTVDGKEYWLMLMEFVTYEVWHNRGLYHYWDYVTEEQKRQKLEDLRALYQEEPPEPENFDDEVQF